MIKKYNKEVGFVYKNENNIDKIYKNNQLVFEQGFIREDSGVPPLTTTHLTTGKNLKGYKIYGNSRQNNLPDGYQEVEWIKSNKDIDLGIKTNNNIQIEAKFLRSTTSTQFVYHSDSGSSLSTNTTAYASANGIWRFGDKSTSIQQSVDVIFETIQNKDGVWFNGEKAGNYTSVPTFTSSTNLCALGSASNPSNQLYYLKTKDYGANTYSHIWIPCKRTSDNAYGLYDVIGNEFYTNNQATITAGNNVTPSPNYPIEIESVGDKTVNVMPSAEKSIKQENGVTIECDGFGTYIITGTASHDTTIYFDLKSSFTIPVSKYKDGEGTMSLFNSDSSLSAYIYFMNNSSTVDYWILSQINRISNSYSLQGGKECNKIGFKVFEGKTVNMTVSPVFTNDGIYPSEPIPYGYKIPITISDGTNSTTTNIYLDEPLRKIGDYADYIDFENGKVIRNIGKFILKGNEVWDYMLDNTHPEFYSYIGGSYNLGSIICYCTHFIGKTRNQLYAGQSGIACAGNYVRVTQDVTDVFNNDVTTFKNWLSTQYNNSTPVEIEYIRATELEESITLPTIPSIKGTTIYSVGTKVQPSNMYIKYKGK